MIPGGGVRRDAENEIVSKVPAKQPAGSLCLPRYFSRLAIAGGPSRNRLGDTVPGTSAMRPATAVRRWTLHRISSTNTLKIQAQGQDLPVVFR